MPSSRIKELNRKVGQAIEKYHLIEENDRILIGLSGGKDSFVLACLLHEFQKKAPVKFDLEVATFDPGFAGFGVDKLAEYARSAGWKMHVVRMDMKKIIDDRNFSDTPCVLCSRLRRGRLYGLMAELKCNKLALGHHLDDALISLLMSMFRGQGLTTMGPNVPGDGGKIRIIRPLITADESLIQEIAMERQLPLTKKCIYAGQLEADGDRQYFKRLLGGVEKRIPNFRANCLNSLGKVEIKHLFDLKYLNL